MADVRALRRQNLISHFNFIWFAVFFWILLRLVGFYRCKNLSATRNKVKELIKQADGLPLIICANHITMIDSLLLTVFMFPIGKMLLNFRLFPWNVPEIKNFGKSRLLKLMCYLGKCIYVERDGDKLAKQRTLEKMNYIVANRQLICIFPEGGRSRTGFLDLDRTMYGVGRLIRENPGCQVLCCYLRGSQQKTYSFFPKRGDLFSLELDLIQPSTISQGIRGDKELTMQVMGKLQNLEDKVLKNLS